MINGLLLGGAIGALMVTCVAFRACLRAEGELAATKAFVIGGIFLFLAAGLGFSAFALMGFALYWIVICAFLFLTLVSWAFFRSWKKEAKR